MAYPLTVTLWAKITPVGRSTNISGRITPPSLQHFDYFPGFTFTGGIQLRVLNTDGHPWWLTEPPPIPTDRQYDDAYAAAFQGGVGSPQHP